MNFVTMEYMVNVLFTNNTNDIIVYFSFRSTCLLIASSKCIDHNNICTTIHYYQIYNHLRRQTSRVHLSMLQCTMLIE